MYSGEPIKSILKKTHSKKDIEADRHRNTALQHANFIQQRKNYELEILLSIETLIDYPLELLSADASNPSSVDKLNFRNLIRLFQPNDYDALIVERNINERCGYTLCPNQRRKEDSPGKYRLVGKNGKAKDFRVVEKEEIEKWCSDTCAVRAMYVKVQLNEIPAWERISDESEPCIDLLVGLSAEKIDTFKPTASLDVDPSNTSRLYISGIAASQKEKEISVSKISFPSLSIKEKNYTSTPKPPLLEGTEINCTLHLNLEGYTTMSDFSTMNPTSS